MRKKEQDYEEMKENDENEEEMEGREEMKRICRTACWWRRALVSFPCISCYKVLSANKKLNNHIIEIHKDPASSILCYKTFEKSFFFIGDSFVHFLSSFTCKSCGNAF